MTPMWALTRYKKRFYKERVVPVTNNLPRGTTRRETASLSTYSYGKSVVISQEPLLVMWPFETWCRSIMMSFSTFSNKDLHQLDYGIIAQHQYSAISRTSLNHGTLMSPRTALVSPNASTCSLLHSFTLGVPLVLLLIGTHWVDSKTRNHFHND